MLNVDEARMYNDLNGLAKLKQGAREKSPEAVKEVAKQFESLFLNMVMKSMRQAKLAEGMLDSQQSEFYQEMYDQQMALQLSGKPGIGLADVIAKQLAPKTEDKAGNGGKLALSDYLSRAAAVGHQPARAEQSQVGGYGESAIKPLEASGLSRLQQTLERLERSQQANESRWQTLEQQWAGGDSGEMTGDKVAFVNELLPHARQAARELGVDANLLLAQAALETGWGQAVIKNRQGESSFNLFNIKADRGWQGKQAKVSTLEFDGGVAQKTMAGFRVYDSYQASFSDYVDFIKSNPRYGDALKQTANPAAYIRELQAAGYATDPRYAEKVMSIYRGQIAGQSTADAG